MAPPTSNRQQTHPYQAQNNNQSTIASRTTTTQSKNTWTLSGLYERSQKQQQEKVRNMEALRMEMLEDYTFTPQIGLLAKPVTSYNPGSNTTTESASSGESGRLYRGGSPRSTTNSCRSTPQKNLLRGLCNSPADESGRFTPEVGVSCRLEEAYKKKVAQMRAKPISEKHEKLLRIRNMEDKELADCTFWPKTNWGTTTNKQSTTTRRSTALVMKPSAPTRPLRRIQPQYRAATKTIIIPDIKGEEPPLPKEIIVTRTHPWDAPERHQNNQHNILSQSPVSPLRELPLVQNMVLKQTEKALIRASNTNLQKKVRESQVKESLASLHNKTSQVPDYGSI